MTLKNVPDRPREEHVFECSGCGVVYMTEDHVPIAGNEKELGR
jgi:hypothetical protein